MRVVQKLVVRMLGNYIGQTLLLLISSAVVFTCGIFVALGNGNDHITFVEASMTSWNMLLNPSVVNHILLEHGHFTLRTYAITIWCVITLTLNLLISATYIDYVRMFLEYCRLKYNSIVADKHIVIIGWTPKTIFMISELLHMLHKERANKYDTIVVSGTKDERTMQDAVSVALTRRVHSVPTHVNIVFKQRTAALHHDIELLGLSTARFIICLFEAEEYADVSLMQTLIALQALPDGGRTKCTIVAEVNERTTISTARDLSNYMSSIVIFAHVTQSVDNIVSIMCVDRVLGAVLIELFSYRMNTFSVLTAREIPDSFVGMNYFDLVSAYEGSIICGIFVKPNKLFMPPSSKYTYEEGHEIVILCSEPQIYRDTERLVRNYSIAADCKVIPVSRNKWHQNLSTTLEQPEPINAAIVGSRSVREMNGIINTLLQRLTPGSIIYLISCSYFQNTSSPRSSSSSISVVHIPCQSFEKHELENLVPWTQINACVVVGDMTRTEPPSTRDAHVYSITVVLRNINKNMLLLPMYDDMNSMDITLQMQTDDSNIFAIHRNAIEAGLIARFSQHVVLEKVAAHVIEKGGLCVFSIGDDLRLQSSVMTFHQLSLEIHDRYKYVAIGYANADNTVFLNPVANEPIHFRIDMKVIVITHTQFSLEKNNSL